MLGRGRRTYRFVRDVIREIFVDAETGPGPYSGHGAISETPIAPSRDFREDTLAIQERRLRHQQHKVLDPIPQTQQLVKRWPLPTQRKELFVSLASKSETTGRWSPTYAHQALRLEAEPLVVALLAEPGTKTKSDPPVRQGQEMGVEWVVQG